jgi:hypothetical protein
MLGKRTTQALVAQGIEHRFPKVLCRTVRSVPWTRLFFRLIRVRSRASANGREDAPAQVTDGADQRRTLHRSPENRKVGGSTPPLATTFDQCRR